MEKGIIKMIIKVTIIAIVLLAASLFVAGRYGGLMMKSVSTSQQTNQDN
jgi:cbb3-type cytochrome oxidase subunit 1